MERDKNGGMVFTIPWGKGTKTFYSNIGRKPEKKLGPKKRIVNPRPDQTFRMRNGLYCSYRRRAESGLGFVFFDGDREFFVYRNGFHRKDRVPDDRDILYRKMGGREEK